MEKLTETLAEFSNNISFNDLPRSVIERTKLLILDTVGIIIRARNDAESTQSLISAVKTLDLDNGKCNVFSDKIGYAPSAAALINGTLAHSLDFDDTHAEASLHSSAPILSSALAAAQMKNCSGQQLITACVLGYEVQIRLGLAGGASAHYNRGFHPTATCGVFGAAAAAGHILELDKNQFISAFGIALSQASGSMQFLTDGSWTKRSHVGQAAQNGLNCAVLALEGFKGPKKAFEGKWGYLNSFVSGGQPRKALKSLGKKFETLNLGVKPYPSCRYSHAAIDGILKLKSDIGFKLEKLEKMEIGLSNTALNIIGLPLKEKQNPKNVVDGQFSMPFCAAIAVRSGRFVWDDYKKNLYNKETLSLCKRIKISHNKSAEKYCPEYMSANVKIKVSGKEYEKFIKIPKGDPENFMTKDEFIEKFDGLAKPYLTDKKLDEIKSFMLKLEVSNNLNSLFELSN